MHNIVGDLHKVLARSLDGGETWETETPECAFDGIGAVEAPAFILEESIIRVSGGYDHGGDDCPKEGGFYLSHDRGKSWNGPYRFTGLDDFSGTIMNTARTRVLGDLVFLSARDKRHWGSDWTICARHDGKRFQRVGVIEDTNGRVVMPAASKIGNRIVVCARRRGGFRRDCWIDSYCSDDGGKTWASQGRVADTGGYNGNPPALICINGPMVCAFANRSDHQIQYAKSSDGGDSWSAPKVLRESPSSDIGYPQLFGREDGQLVCVYYFSDAERPHQHIAATIFDPQEAS